MSRLIGEADRTAHVFYKALHHRQSQPGAALTAGAKWTDAMLQHILGKSDTVILHVDAQSLFVCASLDTDSSRITFKRIGRIQYQIQQGLPYPAFRQMHRQRTGSVYFQTVWIRQSGSVSMPPSPELMSAHQKRVATSGE